MSNLVNDIVELQEIFPVKMQVFSTLGQEVIPSTIGRELNVSNLSAGIYFILLEKDGVQSTQKFIKM